MLKMNSTGNNLWKAMVIGCIELLISGCGQISAPNAPTDTIQVTETLATAILPTQEETLQMTPSTPTPADPLLQGLVEKAKKDLAQRLSISVDQINFVEAAEVEWSDSSLGCPQPGMDYLQVITPGYQILLETDGQWYDYHSNRNNIVVFCENSTPPISPNP